MSISEKRVHVQHWLYDYIPRSFSELKSYNPLGWVTWAILGNDDDGIFGEQPTSGKNWLAKWEGGWKEEAHGVQEAVSSYFDPGVISFQRFAQWQLRNPLHNFTFYVIGIAWMKNIPLFEVILITTKEVKIFQMLRDRNIFPMGNDSGLYFGIHGYVFPCLSFRVNLPVAKRVEGYIGWRTRGNFGLAFRFKNQESARMTT